MAEDVAVNQKVPYSAAFGRGIADTLFVLTNENVDKEHERNVNKSHYGNECVFIFKLRCKCHSI